MKILRAIGVTAAFATAIAGLGLSDASAAPKRGGFSLPTVESFVSSRGVAAVKAANPGLSTADIEVLGNDSTARITLAGKVLFVDKQAQANEINVAPITTNVTNIPASDFLSLNSRPGSDRTIYLDVDGHTVPVGTVWDDADFGFGGNPVVAGNYPAFTMDNSLTFSTTEKQAIINAWAAVAEDYAMFDVNVTTEFPGDEAITRSSLSDTTFGTRALVTGGNLVFNPGSCNCGGIAYTDVFDESIDSAFGSYYGIGHDEWQPAFVFVRQAQVDSYNSAQAGKFISDIVSHEVGHNLSLLHDGSFEDSNRDDEFVDIVVPTGVDDVTGDLWTEYFDGEGDSRNWAPIMGAGYVNGVVQWSDGDYGTAANPSSNREDDISAIAATGLDLLLDESNNASGSALFVTGNATDGLIGRRNDVDWFKVTVTNRALGLYSGPPTPNTNLDTKLTLRDGAGKELFSTDALSDMSESGGYGVFPVTGMDGILNADLPNGTYYVTIEGVGRTGAYSDYGSLGAYSIKTRTPSVTSIATIGNPTISGTRRKGRTLTANYGTWTSGVSIAKQWLRDGVAISGATAKTYVLKSADVGHKISVRLVGTKSGKRTAVKVSSKTAAITN